MDLAWEGSQVRCKPLGKKERKKKGMKTVIEPPAHSVTERNTTVLKYLFATVFLRKMILLFIRNGPVIRLFIKIEFYYMLLLTLAIPISNFTHMKHGYF